MPTKKMHITFIFYFLFLFFYILDCVLLIYFFFLLDIASIVAWYSVSNVSHIIFFSHINLRKIILKFHYAITKYIFILLHTHTHTLYYMWLKGVRKFKGLRFILVNSQIFNFLWFLCQLLLKQLNMSKNVIF